MGICGIKLQNLMTDDSSRRAQIMVYKGSFLHVLMSKQTYTLNIPQNYA